MVLFDPALILSDIAIANTNHAFVLTDEPILGLH